MCRIDTAKSIENLIAPIISRYEFDELVINTDCKSDDLPLFELYNINNPADDANYFLAEPMVDVDTFLVYRKDGSGAEESLTICLAMEEKIHPYIENNNGSFIVNQEGKVTPITNQL